MNKIHRTQLDKTALSKEALLRETRHKTKIDRSETCFGGKSLENSASFSSASREGDKLRERDYW